MGGVAGLALGSDGAALLASRRPVHFLSMSGFALHSDGSAPETWTGRADAGADGERPTLHARHVDDGAITIDGAADEAAWKNASAVTFDTDWSGAKAGASTSVRAAWSKSALYMSWYVADAGFFVDQSRPIKTEREKLYEEDCVELFLAPDPAERTRYFEVEVGPLGHFFDIAVDKKRKKSDTAWSSLPEIATRLDRQRHNATIELALRSPDILRVLKAGAKLPFALYRMEGKSPRLYLAWSPTRTPKPDFHVPEAFGTLSLE